MTKITEISGVGPATAKLFATGGFNSVGDIAQADMAELATIRGVGEKRAALLISAAKALLGEGAPSSAGDGLDRLAGLAKESSKKKGKKEKKKKRKANKDKKNIKKKKKGKKKGNKK